jgi:hypothetical protein
MRARPKEEEKKRKKKKKKKEPCCRWQVGVNPSGFVVIGAFGGNKPRGYISKRRGRGQL